MVTGLNFETLHRHTKVVGNFKGKSCYGAFVGSSEFTNNSGYKNYIVTLFMADTTINRETTKDRKFVLNERANPGNFCKNDLNLEYLKLLENVYFKYDAEEIETTFSDFYNIFSSNASKIEISDEKIKYIKVTIDLSQFNSPVSAKNALFLIRNGDYNHNKESIFYFTELIKLFPNLDKHLMYSFAEFLDLLEQNTSNGEYKFIGRGHSRLNKRNSNGSNREFEIKSLTPMDGEKYWKILDKASGNSVDSALASSYFNRTFNQSTILGFSFIPQLLKFCKDNQMLINKLDMKRIKEKILLFCNNFTDNKKSTKYLKFKNILDEKS